MDIHREITPLKASDCFLVFDRQRYGFDFPVHFHPEYEINFIRNAKGARRIIGDHIGEISDYELAMVGSNIYHGWENYKNNREQLLHEITIQFPRNLFDQTILSKNIFKPINELFKNSTSGILFSEETAKKLEDKLISLNKGSSFDNFLDFQSLLYDLAISRDKKLLTNISAFQNDFYNSGRIEKVYSYIREHYSRKIKVEEAASLVNMTVISFSRLIKQRTGKTFIEFVNDLRLGFATRKLIETNESISEICYNCGFNNVSHFNRLFKRKQNSTPSEFRENFEGTKNIF